jgi:hypothetical protein
MISKGYTDCYTAFAQDVDFAVRIWHSHSHLEKKASEDPRLLSALNKAPRYWTDQRYLVYQTTIILLGRIFDIEEYLI